MREPDPWYINVAEVLPWEPRWVDESDAEDWIESLGVEGIAAAPIEPRSTFLVQLPRPGMLAIRDALYVQAVSEKDAGFQTFQFAESFDEDAKRMDAGPTGSWFSRSLNPLSYAPSTVWAIDWLTEVDARRVARLIENDPSFGTPLVGSYEVDFALRGDVLTARDLVQAMDTYDGHGRLVTLRDSLREWLRWVEGG